MTEVTQQSTHPLHPRSALEDVLVLGEALEAAGDRLAAALPAFETQRMPDVAALVKLVQVSC